MTEEFYTETNEFNDDFQQKKQKSMLKEKFLWIFKLSLIKFVFEVVSSFRIALTKHFLYNIANKIEYNYSLKINKASLIT